MASKERMESKMKLMMPKEMMTRNRKGTETRTSTEMQMAMETLRGTTSLSGMVIAIMTATISVMETDMAGVTTRTAMETLKGTWKGMVSS